MNPNGFKEGQTVWDVVHGRGVVTDADSKHVSVMFGCTLVYYTPDGRVAKDCNRSLFFSEPKVIAETEPLFEPTLKSGEVVVAQRTGLQYEVITVLREYKTYVATTRGVVLMKTDYTFYRLGDKIY